MFKNVIFLGTPISAWVVDPNDVALIAVLAKTPQPSANHVLAQIACDGPFRWLLLAD